MKELTYEIDLTKHQKLVRKFYRGKAVNLDEINEIINVSLDTAVEGITSQAKHLDEESKVELILNILQNFTAILFEQTGFNKITELPEISTSFDKCGNC